MNDQIKITVSYFSLKKYLIEQLGYSKHAAVTTINDIRKLTLRCAKLF